MMKMLIVLLGLLLPVFVQAELTYDEQGDLIRPNSERSAGILNGIGPEVEGVVSLVVINDTNYKVDEQTIYRDENGELVSPAGYKTGTHLEFFAIQNLVTKIRVLSSADVEDDKEIAEETSPTLKKTEELHLDSGVWKN